MQLLLVRVPCHHGWLKDLAAEYEVEELAELGRRMIAAWPRGRKRPEPNGLRSALSKADRRIGLTSFKQTWRCELVDAALGAPPGTTRDHVAKISAPAERDASTIALRDLASARRVELREVELPPGVPTLLSAPTTWDDDWWYAPSGSGRSFVAAWLRSRGLADVVVARDWDAAASALTSRRDHGDRPLYLDLDSYDHWHEPRAQIRSRLLVASSSFPPGGPPFRRGEIGGPLAAVLLPTIGAGALWRLHVSTTGECLQDLVEWVRRWTPDPGPDAAAFGAWARDSHLAAGRIHQLDFALSTIAIANRYGLARLAKATDERGLLALFVTHRLQEAGTGHATMMAEQLVERLVRAAHRSMTGGGLSPEGTHPPEAWRELLANPDLPTPLETRRLLDLLKQENVKLPREVRDRVVREASDPRTAADALTHSGLLTGGAGSGACRLEPSWFCDAVMNVARDSVVRDTTRAWGNAVLQVADPAPLVLAVMQRLSEDPHSITRIVSDCRDDEPDLVVALEVVFRCAGALVLTGELPTEVVRKLWDRQMALAVEGWNGTPEPRVPFPNSTEYLLTDGAWFAAALALSRQLGPDARGPLAWGVAKANDESLITALRHIDDALKTLELGTHAGVLAKLFELGSALAAHVGLVSRIPRSDFPATIHVPHLLVSAAGSGALALSELKLLDRDETDPDRVREEAGRRGVGWDAFCSTVWTSWLAAGGSQSGVRAVYAESNWATELWARVPRDVMREGAVEIVKQSAAHGRPVPYDVFSDDAWSGLLDSFPEKEGTIPLDNYDSIFERVPEHHAVAAVRAGIVGPYTRTIRIFWRRFPAALLVEVRRRLDESTIEDAAAFVLSVPSARAEQFLAALDERLRREPPQGRRRIALSEWAREATRSRGPEWRGAYRIVRSLSS